MVKRVSEGFCSGWPSARVLDPGADDKRVCLVMSYNAIRILHVSFYIYLFFYFNKTLNTIVKIINFIKVTCTVIVSTRFPGLILGNWWQDVWEDPSDAGVSALL